MGLSIESEKTEDLLGIKIDQELNFDEHINYLCKKACQKLNVLARITPYIIVTKNRNIMKAFMKSQFGNCPLIWMCHNR